MEICQKAAELLSDSNKKNAFLLCIFCIDKLILFVHHVKFYLGTFGTY